MGKAGRTDTLTAFRFSEVPAADEQMMSGQARFRAVLDKQSPAA
jgi:hypothetical protein